MGGKLPYDRLWRGAAHRSCWRRMGEKGTSSLVPGRAFFGALRSRAPAEGGYVDPPVRGASPPCPRLGRIHRSARTGRVAPVPPIRGTEPGPLKPLRQRRLSQRMRHRSMPCSGTGRGAALAAPASGWTGWACCIIMPAAEAPNSTGWARSSHPKACAPGGVCGVLAGVPTPHAVRPKACAPGGVCGVLAGVPSTHAVRPKACAQNGAHTTAQNKGSGVKPRRRGAGAGGGPCRGARGRVAPVGV
jgi:hypothetical protein